MNLYTLPFSDPQATLESVGGKGMSLVKKNQPKLSLTEKQIQCWVGKRYIVLIEVTDVKEIPPFAIDRSKYGNMDDWLPVEKIEAVRK